MLYTHAFTGIGTQWHISVDHTTEPKDLWCLIDETVNVFADKFSRFKSGSLVNHFKNSPAGVYKIDPEFAVLLSFAQKLKEITSGQFNPAISELLSLTGYDSSYSFTPQENKIKDWQIQTWSITEDSLRIEGPISFDFGGFGKGYLIDKLSSLITSQGFSNFIVDGGGDMYGTQKGKNQPWNIAIENPHDNTQSIGVIKLDHKGLAVSDIFKRRWNNRHHIVDPIQKGSADNIIACSVLADNAMTADGLTTCFMLSPQKLWQNLSQKFHANYLVITSDNQIIVDPNWPGEF
jgi:FAD:protein FMN transferase